MDDSDINSRNLVKMCPNSSLRKKKVKKLLSFCHFDQKLSKF